MSTDAKSPSVDVGTLAKLFNLTAVRVQQLAKDGVITKSERGRYDLWSSIRGYIKYLQERKVNQWDDGDKDDEGYGHHRSRLTRAKADMAEIEASIAKGQAHDAGAVEAVWTDMLMNCRSKLLAMPTRLAPKLRKETHLTSVREILEMAIHDALAELASYDPARITREYLQTHRLDVATAPEVDGESMG